jgi:methionine-rich copper-binding protein CopC
MQLSSRVLPLLVALSLAVPVSAAHAHPRLLKATPAADSRAEAPRQIALSFNEDLDLALTRVTILRGEVPVRPDSMHLAADDDKTVVATFATALAPGRYTVRWQVTGDDGHPVRGQFSFDVLPARAATAALAPRPAQP